MNKDKKNAQLEQVKGNSLTAGEISKKCPEIMSVIEKMPNGAIYRLMKNVQTGILGFDYVCGTWEKIMGVSAEDTLSDASNVFKNGNPDEMSLLMKTIEQLENFDVEVLYFHPVMKKNIWIQISSYPRREGNYIYADGFIFDVTKRKNNELALAESERKQRLVFENTKDVFWIADFETTRFTFVGGNSLDTFGAVGEAFIGMSFYECFLPERRGVIEALVKQKVKEFYEIGAQNFQVEEQHYNKDGIKIWMESSFRFVPDENGKITQVVGVERDIDERKKAELALAESESKQRFVFENTKDVFWIADYETTKLTFVSGNCLDTFGAVSEAFIGMSFYECFLPETRGKIKALMKQKVEEFYETGAQHFQVIEQHYDKNGEKIWMETSFQLAPDENGKITQIVGVVKNIDEITEKNYELEELHATKDKLFSVVAHDLRSPMAALMSVMKLTHMKVLDTETQAQMFKDISNRVDDVYILLDNLLRWAKSQMQGQVISPIYFDVQDEIRMVMDGLQLIASAKKVTLNNRVKKQDVFSDRDMFSLVVRNLATNALKYTSAGGSVTIDSELTDNMLVISVADTGTGISQEVQDKLFKLSETQSQRGTGNETGAGLGLVLCADFVKANGGKIWFSSAQGEGSTFFFSVPVKN